MKLDLKWRREQDVTIVTLLGRIDSTNSEYLLSMVEEGLKSDDRTLLLDLERVSFISSAGLRVCLILARRFSSEGQAFALCSLSEFNQDIVAVSGFDKLIPVHESVQKAIESIQNSVS